ncbi:hypothetical protein SAMN04489841_1387 [Natrinema salaciae]|uniref:Uncharacterized protein n=1 Tax=Natrinema salaciae TaxID=1186196 RepID=A0A1H9EUV7_9EURY|nr:hypothetical protein SAMN04489841_1387 [Natrinema salaciae]
MSATNRHQCLRGDQLEREAAHQLKLLAEAKAIAGVEPSEAPPTTTDTPTTDSNSEVEA